MNDLLLQKVKNYFSVNMSPEERSQFKKEVASNQELAALFNLYQTIENGASGIEENLEEETALRNSLKRLHEAYVTNERHHEHRALTAPNLSKEEDNVRRLDGWQKLAFAAVLIGIIALVATWLLPERKREQDIAHQNEAKEQPESTIDEDTSQPLVNRADADTEITEKSTPQQDPERIEIIQPSILTKEKREALYAENFKADKIPDRIPDLMKDAIAHYNEQEYGDAIAAIDAGAIQTSLEEQRSRGMQDEQQEQEERLTLFYAHYYKALSHMAENRAAKAIPELRNAVNKSPDKYWLGKTRWYLALAHLETGKVKEAMVFLKYVANTKESREYRLKALKLIKELPAP